MDFDKLLRKIFYASAATVLLAEGNSLYHLYRFNTTPGVSEASMSQVGPVSIRNYNDRREIAESLDPQSKAIANSHLDSIDTSNAVLGASGLIAILSNMGSIALLARKKSDNC